MKTFKIRTIETETWTRFYIVKANTKKLAEEKFFKDINDMECYDGEQDDWSTEIDEIEEVEE